MQRLALYFPAGINKDEVIGYQRVRSRLIAGLRASGFTVLEVPPDETAPNNVIQISHLQPVDKPAYRRIWERRPGVQAAILYTTFESENVPPDWVSAVDEFDAIWVTSKWCKERYEEALEVAGKSKPIYVVPHGVDIGCFPPMLRPKNRGDDGEAPFTFLWKGMHWNDRKQGNLVLEAFEKMKQPNMRLLMKALPFSMRRHLWQGPPMLPEGVSSVSDYWTDEELRAALWNADCFVQPSRCEGFGLEPLEALATGLPTILTPYSGVTEYVEDVPQAVELPFTKGDSFYNEAATAARQNAKHLKDSQVQEAPFNYGTDAHISVDDLARVMRMVFENRTMHKGSCEGYAMTVHEKWSWGRVVKAAVDSLDDMGLLPDVSWMAQKRHAWLDDIRRARISDVSGPWAAGVEPVENSDVLEPESVVSL